MTTAAIYPQPASVVTDRLSKRFVSLDVFRGLVILCMLMVNNIGDPQQVGYFWKHAEWKPVSLASDLSSWWHHFSLTHFGTISQFPLLKHCTLADAVMPLFMLIMGISLPFSVAAARGRSVSGSVYWVGIIRRGLTIYALGWCIGLSIQFLNWRSNPDPNRKLMFTLGMDVLQLLGLSFIFARIAYQLPRPARLALAGALFLWHWSLLRFYPQGTVPAGTFTEQHNAIGLIYSSWPVFRSFPICSCLKFNVVGLLSVPPAAGMILVGTWIGDQLSAASVDPMVTIRQLLIVGILLIATGIAWSLDLPMNKPRWTPCYLLYCSGIGAMLIAILFWIVDVKQIRHWTWPFAALGVNAIGVYFLSIMAKVWFLNMPRVSVGDGSQPLTHYLVTAFQRRTTPAFGSWMFTCAFTATVWSVSCFAYLKRLIWKV
jgi:predicted acyltransferase